MGLFDKRDKKRKSGGTDDFDSPVEQIDLGASTPAPRRPEPAAVTPAKPAPSQAPVSGSLSSSAETKPAEIKPVEAKPPEAKPPEARPAAVRREDPPAPPPSRPARVEPEPAVLVPEYGIDKAIALMRTLPKDNVEIVVQVVKGTLESSGIHIRDIIVDADHKQDGIQRRITSLREEIAEYEGEIAVRRAEIATLDEDFRETSLVRERLELAENLGKAKEELTGARKPVADTADKQGRDDSGDEAWVVDEAASDGDASGATKQAELSSASGTLGARKPLNKPSGQAAPPSSGPSRPASKTTIVTKK